MAIQTPDFMQQVSPISQAFARTEPLVQDSGPSFGMQDAMGLIQQLGPLMGGPSGSPTDLGIQGSDFTQTTTVGSGGLIHDTMVSQPQPPVPQTGGFGTGGFDLFPMSGGF